MNSWGAVWAVASLLCLVVVPHVLAIAANHSLTKRPQHRLTATLIAAGAAVGLMMLGVAFEPGIANSSPYPGLALMGSLAAASIAIGAGMGSLSISVHWRQMLTSAAIVVVTMVCIFVGVAAS